MLYFECKDRRDVETRRAASLPREHATNNNQLFKLYDDQSNINIPGK